jgi:hypothetical protein
LLIAAPGRPNSLLSPTRRIGGARRRQHRCRPPAAQRGRSRASAAAAPALCHINVRSPAAPPPQGRPARAPGLPRRCAPLRRIVAR